MALKETILKITDGTLSDEEQLALLRNLEASIEAKKIAKEQIQQKDMLEEAISTIANRIKDHERNVANQIKSLEEFVRIPGPQGPKGLDGKAGKDGKDGLKGADGKNGRDGQDGKDGVDGVSVVDAYLAADNSLVIVLSNGNEIDAGMPFGLGGDGNANISVLTQTGETSESLATKYVAFAFETVSKNLRSADGTLNYNAGGLLTSIAYADGITKTLNYDVAENITSIVLSGTTPVDIKLTKTFAYTSGNISSFTYS